MSRQRPARVISPAMENSNVGCAERRARGVQASAEGWGGAREARWIPAAHPASAVVLKQRGGGVGLVAGSVHW